MPQSLYSLNQKVLFRYEYENKPTTNRATTKYASLIGTILIKYSGIEGGITQWYIPQLLSTLNKKQIAEYSIGHAVVSKMSAIDKFNLFTQLARMRLQNSTEITPADINYILKALTRCAELRNIVAHADWSEETESGWFVTNYKFIEDNAEHAYVLHRLLEEDLIGIIDFMDQTSEEVAWLQEWAC